MENNNTRLIINLVNIMFTANCILSLSADTKIVAVAGGFFKAFVLYSEFCHQCFQQYFFKAYLIIDNKWVNYWYSNSMDCINVKKCLVFRII